MCGIVGVIGAYTNGFTQEEQNIFRDMLFVDTLRGWDSTGVFMVSNVGNVLIRKAALHGPDFLAHDAWKAVKTASWSKGMFMVGHNRAATRGTVSDQNAHPFWVDDKIVLVQNGTYNGDHKHHKDVEVDTEAVAHVIAEHDDVEQALQKINAAYALVWYNAQTKALHLIRNEQRPLFTALTNEDTIVFASEQETIWWAVSRNGQKLKGMPKMLEPGVLHTYTLSGRTYEHAEKKLDITYRRAPKEYDTTAWDNEYDWRHYYQKHHQHNRHHFQDVVELKPNNESGKKERTFYECLHLHMFKDYAMEQDARIAIFPELRELNRKKILVEWDDYIPYYPDEKDCKKWMLVGKVAFPELPASPLVYTIVSDTSEQDALEMVTNTIYHATVTTMPVAHHITAGDYVVVALFVSELEKVETTVETEDALH